VCHYGSLITANTRRAGDLLKALSTVVSFPPRDISRNLKLGGYRQMFERGGGVNMRES